MTDLADRHWRLVPEEARSGAMVMALDEVAAETAAAGGPRTVRVYRWDPSTLSLGYGQDPDTVDWAACERRGIDVTRRQTGGGGIYHDSRGDISYSIVAPAAELPGDLMESYEHLLAPVFAGLERMGVDASLAAEARPPVHRPACYLRGIDPAHDVVTPGGRKLSGNAQYRQREAVIQHGSLTYERAVDDHTAVFAESIDADRFRERVTSIRDQAGIERGTAVEALETALGEWAEADVGAWTQSELERARTLAERKYGSTSWIRDGEVDGREE